MNSVLESDQVTRFPYREILFNVIDKRNLYVAILHSTMALHLSTNGSKIWLSRHMPSLSHNLVFFGGVRAKHSLIVQVPRTLVPSEAEDQSARHLYFLQTIVSPY